MKKSKVIVPAMALLLFSTAASVTGTVAWFSATRVFNTSADTFAVNSIDGNLKASVWGRVGTEALTDAVTPTLATKASANGVKVRNIQKAAVAAQGTSGQEGYVAAANAKQARLTHGSFNHADTKGWIIDTDYESGHYLDLGTERASYVEETDNDSDRGSWYRKTVSETVSNTTTDYEYFVAFSWEINFEYKFGGGETKVGIFLDTDETSMEVKTLAGADATSGKILTGNGFRIAMYPVTVNTSDDSDAITSGNSAARILGNYGSGVNLPSPLNTERAYIPHYVNGATSAAGEYTAPTVPDAANAVWGTGNYMIPTAADKSARQTEGQATNDVDGDADKVCYIAKPNDAQTGTARLICVAWYEGTSEFIVTNDNTEMNQVTANLTFYGRALSA